MAYFIYACDGAGLLILKRQTREAAEEKPASWTTWAALRSRSSKRPTPRQPDGGDHARFTDGLKVFIAAVRKALNRDGTLQGVAVLGTLSRAACQTRTACLCKTIPNKSPNAAEQKAVKSVSLDGRLV